MTFSDKIIIFLSFTFAVILSLTVHEFSHAYVSHKLGDDTAKINGRMTLNPMAHFDIVGLLSFLILGFGWAKPVPVNAYNFKNIKRDTLLVSLAGIFTNFIFFFVFYPLSLIMFKILQSNQHIIIYILYNLFFFIYEANLVLMVFNLLPVYPLDGFNALASQLKYNNRYVLFMQRYGVFILITLALVFSYTNVFDYLVDFVGYPVRLFWGLFF